MHGGDGRTGQKARGVRMDREHLLAWGMPDDERLLFLEQAVRERKRLLIVGPTGAGKTTLYHYLRSLVPVYEASRWLFCDPIREPDVVDLFLHDGPAICTFHGRSFERAMSTLAVMTYVHVAGDEFERFALEMGLKYGEHIPGGVSLSPDMITGSLFASLWDVAVVLTWRKVVQIRVLKDSPGT